MKLTAPLPLPSRSFQNCLLSSAFTSQERKIWLNLSYGNLHVSGTLSFKNDPSVISVSVHRKELRRSLESTLYNHHHEGESAASGAQVRGDCVQRGPESSGTLAQVPLARDSSPGYDTPNLLMDSVSQALPPTPSCNRKPGSAQPAGGAPHLPWLWGSQFSGVS